MKIKSAIALLFHNRRCLMTSCYASTLCAKFPCVFYLLGIVRSL
nr:hypothetical protein [Aulosira sp. DedVER01a]